MMEEKKENLRRAIDGLTNHDAPDIWSKINEKLAADEEAGRENLSEAVSGLADLTAPDVWHQITDRLEDSAEPTKRAYWRIALTSAASVSILVVAFILLRQPENDSAIVTTSTYSTEEVDVFEANFLEDDFGKSDDGVLQYVNKNCKLMLTKCENPQFKGLYDTYLELGKAKEELKGKLSKTSNKEQLYKYLIRLEKDQAEVGKDLLKMLRYS